MRASGVCHARATFYVDYRLYSFVPLPYIPRSATWTWTHTTSSARRPVVGGKVMIRALTSWPE